MRHERPLFAVMHNAPLARRCARVWCSGEDGTHEAARVHHLAWRRAQQPKTAIVGWMASGVVSPPDHMAAFRAGLKETGHVEGGNVIIDYKWAEGRYERLPEFAADFVARGVAVIAATGAVVSPLAARAATTTIPIVFRIGADPVQA